MRFFLGLDGGQTSTTCLIGDDEGRVLGVGRAGPCNHVGKTLGRERFVAAVGGSYAEALHQANLDHAPRFACACLGLSGGPEDKITLAQEMIEADRYEITHDAAIALAGASGGKPGVIVIAGTGSIAYGRNAAGQTARAGGWGYIFGDEGGAFDMVRQALRAVLRHEEGWGPTTALRGLLLGESGAGSANALMHWFYTDQYPRERVAGLAHLVDEAACAGDPVAQQILLSSAQALSTLAAAVRGQLFQNEPTAVHYVGGVFTSAMLLEHLRLLVEMHPGCTLSPPAFGPAAGALLEAYRIAGVPPRLAPQIRY